MVLPCQVSICPSYSIVFLQAGDLVLYINGQSTRGLTHAQAVEWIHTGGPRLCLVLQRPQEMDGSRSKEVGGGHQKTGEVVDFSEKRGRDQRGEGEAQRVQRLNPGLENFGFKQGLSHLFFS